MLHTLRCCRGMLICAVACSSHSQFSPWPPFKLHSAHINSRAPCCMRYKFAISDAACHGILKFLELSSHAVFRAALFPSWKLQPDVRRVYTL